MPKVTPPVDDPDDRYFWEGAREGRLMLQSCAACGALRHPPSPMFARCGSTERDATASSGRGRIHSWILSHHPSAPDDAPRVVVLVELEEGCRVVSNLLDVAPEDVRNDMAVEVCFVERDGVVLPQFRSAPTPAPAGVGAPAQGKE